MTYYDLQRPVMTYNDLQRYNLYSIDRNAPDLIYSNMHGGVVVKEKCFKSKW